MYYFAFVLLALSMLCALAGAAWAVKSLWPRTAPAAGKASRRTSVPGLGFVEKANLCLTGCYIIASAILIYALASYDFSLVYLASYTDRCRSSTALRPSGQDRPAPCCSGLFP